MDFPKIDENTSFAVLGLGKFGMTIAKELAKNDYHVLCCDKNPVLVHEVSDIVATAVEADTTEASVLVDLGISNYDVVVVAFSNDLEAELLTTMVLKEMGVPFVLAKATGLRQKKILENVGADLVIMPEVEMAEYIAQKIMNSDPLEYIHRSSSYEILEMSPKREWIGKSLTVLDLPKHNGINILILIRDEEVINPNANTVIQAQDRILALHTELSRG